MTMSKALGYYREKMRELIVQLICVYHGIKQVELGPDDPSMDPALVIDWFREREKNFAWLVKRAEMLEELRQALQIDDQTNEKIIKEETNNVNIHWVDFKP